ncbi:hypothetical protein [Pseudoxanthomonas composti]|uniref:Lipoprotein n=1 Tax=Pseudoxanthomonas composti TaxID=2137479 RepID=A0A4Q1JU68_9GAMM|nr:hypothetical protein [Pseudoxanthomonas composti]RXR02742.1 hypothetical protein EPA99_14790 [Pseudoxanthomonas composti]
MRVRPMLAMASVLWILAGCRQYPASECEKYLAAGDVSVRVPMDDSSNAAIPLNDRQVLAGTFAPPATLHVKRAAVQIGNSGGAAQGKIALKLCQDERCTIGRAELAGSKDNDYLPVTLESEFALQQSGGVVRYELARESGDDKLVVWVYPAQGKESLTINGNPESKVLNLMLYQR